MAAEKSRSGHQGTSEAGYQDVSLSGENSGPGSTEKLRQRHPSRQLGKEQSNGQFRHSRTSPDWARMGLS